MDINILPLIYLIRAVKDGLFRKVLHFGFRFEYECVDDVDIMIARAIHYNIICCIPWKLLSTFSGAEPNHRVLQLDMV